MKALKMASKEQSLSLTKKLLPWTLYALLPIALLRLYFYPLPFPPSPEPELPHSNPTSTISHSSSTPPVSTSTPPLSSSTSPSEKEKTLDTPCDYFNGKWIRDLRGPLYNGTTCGTIKEGQNCISHGRPDSSYLYWRWKPNQCNLPRFVYSCFGCLGFASVASGRCWRAK